MFVGHYSAALAAKAKVTRDDLDIFWLDIKDGHHSLSHHMGNTDKIKKVTIA